MSTSSQVPNWVANRILAFVNRARSVADLLDGSVQDDPSDGPGRTLGPTVAARILRHKASLPRRRYTTFAELDDVQGIGPGTIQDLVYSFGTAADQAFQNDMYAKPIIYKENWTLEFHRTAFEEQGSFREVVQDEKALRNWLVAQLGELGASRATTATQISNMQAAVSSAYVDRYSNSTPAAAYAFALWFYEFDADNWFSWERIQEACLAYFDYHMAGYPWEMELYLIKGFRQNGLIRNGITPDDLPVVINWAEQSISFWLSALYD